MPSTLLFKFNNFHDISGSEGRLNPDEYSDIATKKAEWKVSVKPPGKLGLMISTNNARDHFGNLWGILEHHRAKSLTKKERVSKQRESKRELLKGGGRQGGTASGARQRVKKGGKT